MKIRVENLWGHDTFYWGLTKLTRQNCRAARVCFPDGTRAAVPVIWKRVERDVWDHGSRFAVSSDTPHALLDIHGLVIEKALTDLDIALIFEASESVE